MKIYIDRIEGNIAVCELETGNMLDIPLDKLPMGAKEGTKLEETDGVYTFLDNSADRKRIQEKMKRLLQK